MRRVEKNWLFDSPIHTAPTSHRVVTRSLIFRRAAFRGSFLGGGCSQTTERVGFSRILLNANARGVKAQGSSIVCASGSLGGNEYV